MFYTNKKMTHPLAGIYGDDWAEETMRRIRLNEIEDEVKAHTRKMMLAAPLSTEERIFSKK